MNKNAAALEMASKNADKKLATYRSVFNDLSIKANKAPSTLISALRLALPRITRIDE